MKVILSRKGFDTHAGRIPSPIFPDGKMISLPISFRCAPTRFADAHYSYDGDDHTIGNLIIALRGRRIAPAPNDLCHTDPDLREETLAHFRGQMVDGWQASLGQDSSAQGHLRNQEVGPGDLFLFFGRFHRIDATKNGGWQYQQDANPIHVLYGWLQIGPDPIRASDPHLLNLYPWLQGHAHLCEGYAETVRGENVIYVAREYLELCEVNARGAGVFRFGSDLVLTAPFNSLCIWDLSRWWGLQMNTAFSHHNTEASRFGQNPVLFNSRGPWQELVVDSEDYPEILSWAAGLIEHHQEQ